MLKLTAIHVSPAKSNSGQRGSQSREILMKKTQVLKVELLESRLLLHGAGVPSLDAPLPEPEGGLGFGAQGTNWLGTNPKDHLSWASAPTSAATVNVFIHNHNGNLTTEKMARWTDALAEINSATASSGKVGLTLVSSSSGAIHVHEDSSSPCGSMNNGVLGCASYSYFVKSLGKFSDGHSLHKYASGTATVISGWNWFTGADQSQIASDQMDYQTVATQELLHLTSLDHDCTVYSTDPQVALNTDKRSVMCGTLSSGIVRRFMSQHDQDILGHIYGPGSSSSASGGGGHGNAGAAGETADGLVIHSDAEQAVPQEVELSSETPSTSDSTFDDSSDGQSAKDTESGTNTESQSVQTAASPADSSGSLRPKDHYAEALEDALAFSPIVDPLVDRLF